VASFLSEGDGWPALDSSQDTELIGRLDVRQVGGRWHPTAVPPRASVGGRGAVFLHRDGVLFESIWNPATEAFESPHTVDTMRLGLHLSDIATEDLRCRLAASLAKTPSDRSRLPMDGR